MSHLTCLGFQYHVFGILNIYLHANFGEFNTFFLIFLLLVRFTPGIDRVFDPVQNH